jgi:peptidyl-prolyl cis-trans isomerase D
MTGGSGYVWFDVPDISPSRERPLDEVKGQVEAAWRDDEIAARLRAKATLMVDKLKAGTPFAEIAAADKLKVEWLPGIKRGQNPASLSAAGVDEVFRTAKDAAGTALGPRPASRTVFRVTEVNVPQLDLKSAEAKPTEETLSRAISEDIVAQYIVQLQSEVGVTINQNALNQITGASPLN